MRDKFKTRWVNLPDMVRKPIVLFLGFFFVIAAGLTGWLPGPGGIPLFLLGIAILATEFEWAERIKRPIMRVIRACSQWYRHHRVAGTLLLMFAAIAALTFLYIAVQTLLG